MVFDACELDESKLPTKRDVVQHLLFLRKEQMQSGAPQNTSFSDFFAQTVLKIRALWQRTKIPLITNQSISTKMKKIEKMRSSIRSNPSHYNEGAWNQLFMICQCRCGIEQHFKCKCRATFKIPTNAIEFYIDQCKGRLLTLDSYFGIVLVADDAGGDIEMVVSEFGGAGPSSSAGYQPSAEEMEEFNEFKRKLSPPRPNPHQLKVSEIRLPNFSQALDRANESNSYGALLATSLLRDLKLAGIDTGVILDRNKIVRERAKGRQKSLAAMKCHDLMKCISFDGKREMALRQSTVAGAFRNIHAFEEHVTMLKEPGSFFIGYVTPINGDAATILTEMSNYLRAEDYSLDHLVAILCDGTAVNTGNKNGVICRFERLLERPLQWLLCLFHFNELPFKALLTSILGKATGPRTFPGIIGREIHICENMPVINSYLSLPLDFFYEECSFDLGCQFRADFHGSYA